MQLLEISLLETARFGITCARIQIENGGGIDLAAINAMAAEKDIVLLTTRISTNDLPTVHRMEADGHRLMDTLVYYERPLDDIPAIEPMPAGMNLRLAKRDDLESVAEVARDAFADYFGHYHADERLDNSHADAGYLEWAEISVKNMKRESPVLVVNDGGKVRAFVTLRLNSPAEGECVLNAVHPTAQGRGIYKTLFISGMAKLKSLGAARMIVSTQVNNYRVQKVWTSIGFWNFKSYYTLHKWYDS